MRLQDKFLVGADVDNCDLKGKDPSKLDPVADMMSLDGMRLS